MFRSALPVASPVPVMMLVLAFCLLSSSAFAGLEFENNGSSTPPSAPKKHAKKNRIRDRIIRRSAKSVSADSSYDWESLQIGFQTGLVISNFSSDTPPSNNAKLGFVLGGQLEVPVASFFSLQPELRLVQRGVGVPTNSGVEIGLRTFELEVPVLAKFKYPVGAVAPFFMFGPNFGFKLGTSASLTDANGKDLPVPAGLVDQLALKGFDLGLDFATGADIKLTPTLALLGEFRFTLGLLNQTGLTGSTSNYRGIQFLTGLSFSL